MLDDPILVQVTRGGMVESRHHGAVAVCDTAGSVLRALGNVDGPVYPRSAIKPLQALPLIESGAADAFASPAAELAVSCASHSGEPRHVAVVGGWLERLGLTPEHLACGGHPPMDPAATEALWRAGGHASRLHDNCSGKHAAMLATARHLGEPVEGYELADHPVQRRWIAVMEEMSGESLTLAPSGIDGCGIPVVGVSLRGLATAAARFAQPSGLPPQRREACTRLAAAMAAEPFLVAGSGRFDTDIMRVCHGAVLVKGGAEGVHMAYLPGRGLGVAVKIADGGQRAASVTLGAVLEALGMFDAEARARLADHLRPTVRNRAGVGVGEIRPAPILTA